MSRPARLLLDPQALVHNLAVARDRAPGVHLYAVVKANAYGHGAPWAGAVLAGAGADGLAVACLEEAQALRDSGLDLPLLLLEGCVDADELQHALRLDLDTVVHCEPQLRDLERAGRVPGSRLWLKLDSGMGRLGMHAGEAAAAWPRLRRLLAAGQQLGLMTHLARADEPGHAHSARQLERLHALLSDLDVCPSGMAPSDAATSSIPLCSAANSAATLAEPAAHGDWLRPGLMLYGASPIDGTSAAALGLQPVATFESALIAVKPLAAGSPVGYGGTWVADADTRLGIVAAGYADGYPRHVAPGTPVLIRGRRVPLVGRVSMDMLAVDLRGCPDAVHGDRVVLWGDGLPVDEIAAASGTIAYDLLCRPSARVRRVVI